MEPLTNHIIYLTEDFMLYNLYILFKCIEIICIEDIKLSEDDYKSLLEFLYNYRGNFKVDLMIDILNSKV